MRTRYIHIVGAIGILLLIVAWLVGCASQPRRAGPPAQSARPPAQTTSAIGRIIYVEGPNVTVGGRRAGLGMEIHTGKEVKTGSGSEVTIRFNDGAILHVYENTDPVFEIIRAPWCLLIRMFYGKAMLDTNNACVRTETPESTAFIDSVIFVQIGQGLTRYEVYKGRIKVAARKTPRTMTYITTGKAADVKANRVSSIQKLTPQQYRNLERRYEQIVFSMPDWSGRSEKEVRSEAQRLGLRLDIKHVRTGRGKPGTVIRQDPSRGARIKRGDSILLYVEQPGPPPISLPAFEGQDIKKVKTRLEGLGLEWRIKQVPNHQYPLGAVVAQNPPPKTKVQRGDTIYLDIATRTARNQTRMPNLVGRTLAQAQAELKKLGLKWKTKTVSTGSAKPGIVVRQMPKAGADITGRRGVGLVVEGEKQIQPPQPPSDMKIQIQ